MAINWDAVEEEVLYGRPRSGSGSSRGENFKAGFESACRRAGEFTTAVGDRLHNTNVFGEPLPELFRTRLLEFGVGTLGGMASRQIARWLMTSVLAGTGGIVFAGGVGAIGGGLTGALREVLRQRRENARVNEAAAALDPELAERRRRLIGRLRQDLQPNDWRRVAVAAGRGAVVGAVGGVFGNVLVDIAHRMGVDPLAWLSQVTGLHREVPSLGNRPQLGRPAVATSTPIPEPTVDHGGAGATALPHSETPTPTNPQNPFVPKPAPDTGHSGITQTAPARPDASSIKRLVPTHGDAIQPGIPEATKNIMNSLDKIHEVTLPKDSTAWDQMKGVLQQSAPGKEFSNADVMKLTKVFLDQNKIVEPDWVSQEEYNKLIKQGWTSSRLMGVGSKWLMSDAVKKAALQIASSK